MFVGDFNNGYLYHFELNNDRNRLDTAEELEDIIFARGFGTDLEVNPYDGHLYVLSVPHGSGSSSNCYDKETYDSNCGVIFRIIPDTDEQ